MVDKWGRTAPIGVVGAKAVLSLSKELEKRVDFNKFTEKGRLA